MSSIVIVRFFPKQGSEARVESILREMVVHTRNEPGCRRYDLYRSAPASAEHTFALIEQYADQAAIQAHRETPHYKAYRASIMELLAKPIDVAIVDPLDVRRA
jgi:quinol monooxygenase YgiN